MRPRATSAHGPQRAERDPGRYGVATNKKRATSLNKTRSGSAEEGGTPQQQVLRLLGRRASSRPGARGGRRRGVEARLQLEATSGSADKRTSTNDTVAAPHSISSDDGTTNGKHDKHKRPTNGRTADAVDPEQHNRTGFVFSSLAMRSISRASSSLLLYNGRQWDPSKSRRLRHRSLRHRRC